MIRMILRQRYHPIPGGGPLTDLELAFLRRHIMDIPVHFIDLATHQNKRQWGISKDLIIIIRPEPRIP